METRDPKPADQNEILIAALYQFFDFHDFEDWLPWLQERCNELELRGILLLAKEGINGTVAGAPASIHGLLKNLRSDPRMAALEPKFSHAAENPFRRQTVRVRRKKEIVTMGVEGIDPRKEVGDYVPPEQWNALIADPEVTVIDVRNDYETLLGKFEGAIAPDTEDFRQFPEWVKAHLDPKKDKKVAMYCTGGIRCEKATALLKREGFEEVYHLHGGILKYLEETPPEETKWDGECFVFDHRVSVDHQLTPGHYALRWECGHPREAEGDDAACPICLTRARKASDDYSGSKL